MSATVHTTNTHIQERYVGSDEDERVYMGGELKQGRGEDCRIGEGLLLVGQPGKAYGITGESKAASVTGPVFEQYFQFVYCGKFHSFPVSLYISIGSKGR